MESNTIQSFMIHNSGRFPQESLLSIQKELENVPQENAGLFLGLNTADPTIILVIAILLGWERFFLGDILLGILKLITFQGFGIWWIIDMCSAQKRAREYNLRKFEEMSIMVKAN